MQNALQQRRNLTFAATLLLVANGCVCTGSKESENYGAENHVAYSVILVDCPSPTGAYVVRWVNEDAIASLPEAEAQKMLLDALLGECSGRIESRWQLELAGKLCDVARKRFPANAQGWLRKAYDLTRGAEVRWVIVDFILSDDKKEKDTIQYIINGLKRERNQVVLDHIDWLLSQSTGIPPLSSVSPRQACTCENLADYWYGRLNHQAE